MTYSERIYSYKNAKVYIDDEASFEGPIVDVKKVWNRMGSFCLVLNIGAKYPDIRRLDVCIWERTLKDYPEIEGLLTIGDNVFVHGLVQIFRGVARITVENSNDICRVESKR